MGGGAAATNVASLQIESNATPRLPTTSCHNPVLFQCKVYVAPLHIDVNYSARGVRSVQRTARRTAEHYDRQDIRGIRHIEGLGRLRARGLRARYVIAYADTVNEYERFQGPVNRTVAADAELGSASRLSARIQQLDPGDSALEGRRDG